MLAGLLRSMPRMSFFWKKKPGVKVLSQEQSSTPSKVNQNLGPLIEKIRKQNESKPKILPPQPPHLKNKLTVVIEIDEVLAYTFEPDQEGYLSSPFRRHDFYTEYPEYQTSLSIYKRKNVDNFLNYLSEEC
jgi:RNA polymerase II subunit A small phosphatase-like protein/CTD small phosphatase-like protein 2